MSVPHIGIVMGDPSGVGPEVVAKLIHAYSDRTDLRLTVIGDAAVFDRGCRDAGLANPFANGQPTPPAGHDLEQADLPVGDPFPVGRATAEGGNYALGSLRAGIERARAGRIDGLVYAPLSKKALALAGSPFTDEFAWLIQELGYNGAYCDCTVLDGLWTARVTSHVPIAEVAPLITKERVIEVATLVHGAIRRSGVARPRLAVAALNPHAGDGGLIGREEIEVLAPAVAELAKTLGDVSGPYPSDSVFLKGRDGDFDGVVCMYHDQGQTALKLMGFGRAISVVAGPNLVLATPAQGTAYDIAGRGVASPEGVIGAVETARRMSLRKTAAQ